MQENTPPSAAWPKATTRVDLPDHGEGWERPNYNSQHNRKHEERIIAPRTVPVILKHGEKRLLVNCFLDENRDTTYVNEDVVETLGISTQKEEITINVANDQKVRLMATTLEIGIESVDGQVDTWHYHCRENQQ